MLPAAGWNGTWVVAIHSEVEIAVNRWYGHFVSVLNAPVVFFVIPTARVSFRLPIMCNLEIAEASKEISVRHKEDAVVGCHGVYWIDPVWHLTSIR